MEMDAYLGNAPLTNRLRADLQNRTLAHALLFAAPDGCGRGFLARCVAADALYPAGGPGAAAVMAGQSPEFLVLAGEGKSGAIPVDAVRRVRAEVFRSSLSATGRAVWVKDAQRMTPGAANALLKVLEEPPKDVLFLLTASSASALPLTVQSRCVLYTPSPVEEQTCVAMLREALPEGADAHWPHTLNALYGGRVGKGLKTLADPERLDLVQDALRAARAAAKGDAYAWMRLFSAYEGRAEGDRQRREALLEDLSDALEAALLGKGPRVLSPVGPALAAALLPEVQNARVALRGNGAPKIIFTALALRMEAKAQAAGPGSQEGL